MTYSLKDSYCYESIKNMCAVYMDAMKTCTCPLWHKLFKTVNYDISDKPRSGRRYTLNKETLKEIIAK